MYVVHETIMKRNSALEVKMFSCCLEWQTHQPELDRRSRFFYLLPSIPSSILLPTLYHSTTYCYCGVTDNAAGK